MVEGRWVLVCLTDFGAAFDRVPVGKALNALLAEIQTNAAPALCDHYKILAGWFGNFCSNRLAAARFGAEMSTARLVSAGAVGCPQGSTTGPWLWRTFTNGVMGKPDCSMEARVTDLIDPCHRSCSALCGHRFCNPGSLCHPSLVTAPVSSLAASDLTSKSGFLDPTTPAKYLSQTTFSSVVRTCCGKQMPSPDQWSRMARAVL